MNPSATPEEIRRLVDEVYERVRAKLGASTDAISALSNAAPASTAAPSAPEDSASASSSAPRRSSCALAHGVAARLPSTRETPESYGGASNPAPSALVEAGACRVGSCKPETGGAPIDASSCAPLAPYLDHTLLKPGATDEQVRHLCDEARRHKFAAVCVNSSHVALCASLLREAGVGVCSVVGFPLGAMSTESKAFETRHAIVQGATEIDMVLHVGKLQQGDYEYVFRDIESVVRAAHGVPVKVILETGLLTDDQKIVACGLAKAAGASFVKTSTGFGAGGATVADIALMRRIVGPELGVKASGGIRDCETARKMIEAGANRIGASASVKIITGAKA